MNGDGNLDIASATATTNSVAVALGDGTGLFPTTRVFKLSLKESYPYDVTTADFNHDGRPDLVTAGYGHGYSAVLLGRPCGK